MAKNELTAKQRTLVDTLVSTGCSIKKAAKAAGYSQSGGGETGRVSGSKAMRLPHVRVYMREQMHEAFGTLAPLALQRLVKLLDAESEHVQLEASKQLLDRAGYGRPKDDSEIVHQIGKGKAKSSSILARRHKEHRAKSSTLSHCLTQIRGTHRKTGPWLYLARSGGARYSQGRLATLHFLNARDCMK